MRQKEFFLINLFLFLKNFKYFIEINQMYQFCLMFQKSIVSEPTCDECIGSVILVSEVIKSDAKIAAIIEFLQVNKLIKGKK